LDDYGKILDPLEMNLRSLCTITLMLRAWGSYEGFALRWDRLELHADLLQNQSPSHLECMNL